MSYNDDERVVELQFKNKQFEANVSQTLSTLDKLKEKLDFTSETASLKQLEKESRSFDLSGIETAVNSIQNRFSTFGIAGMRIIENLVDSAILGATRIVKSLTSDQVMSGFNKYEQKILSVQTIMNATGLGIDAVNEQLDKLIWFTDETSYSFSDMVNNVGKFTSSGIELNSAVEAMMGIADAAGLAGATVNDASHAMDGFSKAIAMGRMDRRNWQWIRTAHMDTAKFKEELLNAAVEAGTLAKAGDGLFRTIDKGTTVTIADFESALSEGWLTAEAMMNALSKFGKFSDKLNAAYRETGVTATSLLDALENYKRGTLNITEYMEDSRVSAERLTEIIAELGDEELSLGEKALRASQEAKTFTDALNATKDAVSSKWMETFDIIVGNYEKAKSIWSDFAEYLYDVFAESGNKRNELLKSWARLGGREDLIQAFRNLAAAIESVITPIKEAFQDIFPPITTKRLLIFTKNLRNLTGQMKLSAPAAEKLKRVFTTIFSVIKTVIKVAKVVIRVIRTVISAIGELISYIVNVVKQSEVLKNVMIGLAIVLALPLAPIAALIVGLIKLRELLADNAKMTVFQRKLELIWHTIKQFGSLLYGFISPAIDYIWSKLVALGTKVHGWIANFGDIIKSIKGWLQDVFSPFANIKTIGGFLITVWETLKNIGKTLVNKIEPIIEKVYGWIKKIFPSISTFVKSLKDNLNSLFGEMSAGQVAAFALAATTALIMLSINQLIVSIRKLVSGFSTIEGVFTAAKTALNSFTASTKAAVFLNVASAIVAVSASLVMLTMLDQERLKSAAKTFAFVIGIIMLGVAVIEGIGVKMGKITSTLSSINSAALLFMSLSGAVLMLAAAFKIISETKLENSLNVWITLGAIMASLIVISAIWAKYIPKLQKTSLVMIEFAASVYILSKALILLKTGLDKDQLIPALERFVVLLGVLAVAAIALRKIGGIGGGFGAIGIAIALWMIDKILIKIAETKTRITESEAALEMLIAVFTTLILVAVIGAVAARGIMGVGVALFGAAMAMLSAMIVLKQVANQSLELKPETFWSLIKIFSMIGIVAAMVSLGGKGGFGALIGMSVALIALAASIKIIAAIQGDIEPALSALNSLMLAFSAMGVAAWLASNSAKSIWAMAAAIGIIVAGLSFLSLFNDGELIEPVFALAVGLISLGVAMALAGVLAATIDKTSLIQMVVLLVAIAGSIIAISMLAGETAIASAGAIAVGLIGLALSMFIASTFAGTINWLALLQMVIMLGAMVGALYLLRDMDAETMIANAKAIALVVGVLGGVTAVLSLFGVQAVIGAAAIAILGAALDLIALAMTGFATASLTFATAVDMMIEDFIRLGNVGPETAENARNAISDISDGLRRGVNENVDNIQNSIRRIATFIRLGFVNGINENIPMIKDAGISTFEAFDEAFREAAGIHSPSVQGMADGGFLMEGIAIGITNGSSEVYNAGETVADTLGTKIKNKLKGITDSIKNWFSGIGESLGITDQIKDVVENVSGGIDWSNWAPNYNIDFTGKFDDVYDQILNGFNLDDVIPEVDNYEASLVGAGNATKSLGKETEETLEPLEVLQDVMTYASNQVNVFANRYIKMNKVIGDTDPIDTGRTHIEQLILTMYKQQNATDESIQSLKRFSDATQKQLSDMKKMWQDYYGSIEDKMRGAYDTFSDPLESLGESGLETFDTASTVMERNRVAAIAMSEALATLQEKGLNQELLTKLYEDGDLSRILGWAKFSSAEIAKINADYEAQQQAIITSSTLIAETLAKPANEIGVTLMEGIGDGMSSFDMAPIEAAVWEEMANVFRDIMRDGGDYSKFSAYGLGEFMVEGLANGIEDLQGLALYAVQQMAQAMIEQFKKEMAAGAQQIELVSSAETGIYWQTEKDDPMLQSLDDNTEAMYALADEISSSGGQAQAIAGNESTRYGMGRDENGNYVPKTFNYTFNQTNNSPKPISAKAARQYGESGIYSFVDATQHQ